MHWLYAHFVGDYLLQTDWMANNKKKSSWACAVHVAIYLLPFICMTRISWLGLLVIAVQHFAQDRSNFVVYFMRVKGSEDFATGPCSPWSVIVTDNILHILFIGTLLAQFNLMPQG